MQISQIHRYNSTLRAQAGNVFVFVFLAIVLLAALTYAVSNSGDEQTNASDKLVRDDQITRLLSQASATSGALQQMILSGANPETLYSSLNLVKPEQAGFNTSPHSLKLYHPYGGGMTYVASTGPTDDSSTVATDMNIVPGAIIKDVGATNVTVGEVVFVATINSQAACKRINLKLRGAETMPVMADATYTALFTNGVTTTVGNAQCANCVGVAEACVENVSGNAWGYYRALLPG